ncbi:MAG: hypothetical protein GY856_42005 [bacterium]|nr:hypothetical protein [bacterium]
MVPVQEPSDVGVLEPGQDLPLVVEAVHDLHARGARVDQLPSHLLLVVALPLRQEDEAHPALSEQALDAVGAEAAAVVRMVAAQPMPPELTTSLS